MKYSCRKITVTSDHPCGHLRIVPCWSPVDRMCAKAIRSSWKCWHQKSVHFPPRTLHSARFLRPKLMNIRCLCNPCRTRCVKKKTCSPMSQIVEPPASPAISRKVKQLINKALEGVDVKEGLIQARPKPCFYPCLQERGRCQMPRVLN